MPHRTWLAPIALVVAAACNNPPAPTPEPVATNAAPPVATQPAVVNTSGAPPTPTGEPAAATASVAASAKAPPTASGVKAPPSGSAGAVATAETPPVEKKGDAASDGSFSTWLQTSGKYKAGQPGTVTAVLTAKEPYHCNDKYPYKFKLDAAPANLTYPQPTVSGMAVTAGRSTMSIPFTAGAAGPATISGQLAFSVCTAEKCLIEKRQLSVAINVD